MMGFRASYFSLIAVLVVVCARAEVAYAQILTGYDEPVVSRSSAVQASPRFSSPPRSVAPSITTYDNFYDEPVAQVRQPVRSVGRSVTDFSSLSNEEASQQPVDLQADDLQYDDTGRIITASGNVILEQAGRILRADQVVYDLNQDKVVASGNVVLNDVGGDVYLSDTVELRNKLKDGMVQGLQATLVDGSRFTAFDGKREDGVRTVMKSASYTACEVCEENSDAPPIWGIKAAEVVHDTTDHTVSYKHARFEVAGVPVFYTPYLSHSDGSVERKSGFLTPSGGFSSNLGAFVKTRYYWDVAPDKDATIGVTAMTEEAPLVEGQWRQRWNKAALTVDGGVTYSSRDDSEAGQRVVQDEEVRGHVFANGLWDMNEKWRSGVRVNWASDDQYLRQYDLDREDVLENEIYAERFSGRNYAVGRVLTFQDIRVGEARQLDQPEVLPEIVANFIGEPGDVPVVGGRWEAQGSFLGLRRDGDEPDLNRLSGDVGWKRRMVSDFGFVSDASVNVRADVYNSRDLQVAVLDPTRSNSTTETRLFPQAHIQSSYPVAKQFERSQLTVEPIVALTIAPSVDVNEDISNEDSQDVQIDASNIFEPNRFPGFDRLEDKSRATYGARVGLYGDGGDFANVFVGQSRRFDDDDNPFPVGSGLDEQMSDYVGQVRGVYGGVHRLDYRFQLDDNNFSSQRHEVDANTRLFNRLDISGNYLFAKALEGTDIDESREQLRAAAGLKLDENWALHSGATQDFGEQQGLREAYAGVDYYGQCVSWSLTGKRNLTDDISGDSDTEILFRVGLKNLGEFASGQ